MLFSVSICLVVNGLLHTALAAFGGPGLGHAAFQAEHRQLYASSSRHSPPKVAKRDEGKYLSNQTQGTSISL